MRGHYYDHIVLCVKSGKQNPAQGAPPPPQRSRGGSPKNSSACTLGQAPRSTPPCAPPPRAPSVRVPRSTPPKQGMGSRQRGAAQVEVGSQGTSAWLVTASRGILSHQDALVPSSPSSRRTAEVDAFTSSKWRTIVLGTPGMRRRGATCYTYSPGHGG